MGRYTYPKKCGGDFFWILSRRGVEPKVRAAQRGILAVDAILHGFSLIKRIYTEVNFNQKKVSINIRVKTVNDSF